MCPSQHTRKEKCLLVMKRCWITRGIEMACYSLSRKFWYGLNTFPSIAGGSGYASCCSKTNVYVTGGNQTLRSFYKYSTALNAWTELAEMNENRCSHAMGCVNDVVYVLGGSDKSYNRETGGWNALCSIEKFDPKVNQWITLKAKLNIPVFDSAYASVKSKIFMFGGSLGSKVGVYLKDIQCFDIALETCTTLYHHLPMTLSLGAACTNNNDVYIVCPNGNVIHFNEETSPPKVFYESTKSQLLGFTAVFIENKILVMGGYSSIGETDVVRKIDILRKNYASVDETRLPFEKNSNELFAAVMHVDRRFLMAEIERNKKTPRGKGQKRI
ncbi:hypothetical protein DPMN_027149 [Dreissena polymorpha]|uniref:Uncharacterized protein n=2 Tax=Dreissena polymorpha TaxID=45954 RepID=A0A9D4RD74_DREPO|nr:hypothetical protein DPMN_027149 [Dreissena polymorpha]